MSNKVSAFGSGEPEQHPVAADQVHQAGARCISDASLLARANGLPLPRLLAAALAEAPLYRIAVGNEAAGRTRIPGHAVACYNDLYHAALGLHLAEMDNPSLLDSVSQLSSATVAKIRQAIETIALCGWEVESANPSFVPLRSSLEALATFLVFLGDGDLNQVWRGDRSAMLRFLSDVQHVGGIAVPVDRLIDCWNVVEWDFAGKRAKDTRYPAMMSRAEKAELKAWRSNLTKPQLPEA